MVGRPRSMPGVRFVCWLTLAALLGALGAGVWTLDTGRAQDDQPGDFPPEGYPRSLTVDDDQFLFDRLIPLDIGSLTEIGSDGDATLYAAADSGPFERLFADLDGGEDGQVGRYLPIQLGADDPACLTDDAELSVITTGDGTNYAFAGEETDLSAETLTSLGIADFGDGVERTLSSDRSEPPFSEFFVSGDDGEQLRFVLLTDEIPEQLTGEIPIGDQTFTVDGNAIDEIDPSSLVDIGCVGPFPLRAANDVTEPYSELFAPVGNGLLRLVAQEDDQGDAEAVETGTPDEAADEPPAGEAPTDDTADEDAATAEATAEDAGDEGDDGEDATPEEVAILPLPEDLPAEVTVDDERFLLDRSVPLDRGDLERVTRDGSQILYAQSEEGPFDAVYLSLPPRNETSLARYLPERIGQGEISCLADEMPNAVLEFDGVRFLFAGYETDITTDNLVPIETSDGTEIYTDSVDDDSAELFLPDDTGLARFIRIGDDGLPGTADETVTFAGAEFTFVGDVSGTVDLASIVVIGCVGPYPMYSDQSVTEPPFGDLYLIAGGLVFQYTPAGGTPEPEVPTEVPTEIPTETPVPTEEPTEIPTEVPTETPVPTEVPTDIPTEEPEATETPEVDDEEVTPTTEAEEESTATVEVVEPTPTVEEVEPTSTPQLQPPAVIPTLAPDLPPPAAATAVASRCVGSAGALDVNGLPERLPRRIQYRGTAFSFAGTEAIGEAGSLTRLGCAGPFDVYSSDLAPLNERLYLRLGDEPNSPLYRYDAARTFTVEVEVTGQVRVVRTEDADYELVGRYQRSIYSSVTAILFVQDADATEPDVIYALRVDADVIGRYEPESESLQAPSDELAERAQSAYINPDLLLNGRTYVLTEILTPQGTTTNGFVTLYAIPNQETPDLFLGVDPREPDLLLFRRIGGGS